MSNEERQNFIGYVQSGVAFLIVGIVVWVGTSIQDIGEMTTRLEERVKLLQQQVVAATADRFTATEAGRHREILVSRVNSIEARMDKVEKDLIRFERNN